MTHVRRADPVVQRVEGLGAEGVDHAAVLLAHDAVVVLAHVGQALLAVAQAQRQQLLVGHIELAQVDELGDLRGDVALKRIVVQVEDLKVEDATELRRDGS